MFNVQGVERSPEFYLAANSLPWRNKVENQSMKNQLIAALVATIILAASSAFAAPVKQDLNQPQIQANKEAPKPYPLKTCIVSDDELGEMGKPIVFVYQGQEIKLCCKDCRADFDKKPAKYLTKLPKK